MWIQDLFLFYYRYGVWSEIITSDYSRTSLYGHPLNTDTSLLRTVFLLPSPYIFSLLNPLNMDTPSLGTLSMPPRHRSVRINGVWLTWFSKICLTAQCMFVFDNLKKPKGLTDHVILQYTSLPCLFCSPCRSCDNTLKNCFFQISSYPRAYGRIIYKKTKGKTKHSSLKGLLCRLAYMSHVVSVTFKCRKLYFWHLQYNPLSTVIPYPTRS